MFEEFEIKFHLQWVDKFSPMVIANRNQRKNRANRAFITEVNVVVC